VNFFGPYSPVTNFSETFSIQSGSFTITGSKGYVPAPVQGVGFCNTNNEVAAAINPFAGLPGPFGTATYTATINGPSGSTTDQGTSDVAVSDQPNVGRQAFNEGFLSGAAPPPPPPPPVPATVMLSPAAATDPVGTSHTVTATVDNAGGQPVPNATVDFNVTGSVNTTGSCTTGTNGQCSFIYQGPNLPGQDAITGCAGPSGGPPCGTAMKTWVLPTSTSGCEVKVTNGGWIVAADGDRSTFGGNAKLQAGGAMSGEEQYTDHAAAGNMDVHSLNVLAIVCKKDAFDIYGRARVNGSGSYFYRIEVSDPDTAGGSDTYGILLSNGYDSGSQPLGGGHVESHPAS
jgi:hypothetical protein